MKKFKNYCKLEGDTEVEKALIRMLDDIVKEINAINKALNLSADIVEKIAPKVARLNKVVDLLSSSTAVNNSLVYGRGNKINK